MKRFLHELQFQLSMVKEHLAKIHVERGPLARPLSPELQARRQRLLARKADLEEKIMFYDDDDKAKNTQKPVRRDDSAMHKSKASPVEGLRGPGDPGLPPLAK